MMRQSKKSCYYVVSLQLKFSTEDLFSKCDRSFLRMWSYLLRESLMVNFVSCAACARKLVGKANDADEN